MKNTLVFVLALCVNAAFGQKLSLGDQTFELKNVTGSIVDFQGEKVLKIERDLNAIPFDPNRLEATVDEPHYAKLTNLDFEDGTFEVKMYSQLQDPSPFQGSQGFIGVAFRADEHDKAFESIYLRPRVGRSENQLARNRTVQYFAYPDHKFQTLRNIANGKYEAAAPVNINEWITMRIEVAGERAEMFINDAKYSSIVVDKMLSKSKHGSIALYVDIGTVGYFKDLKIIPEDINSATPNTQLIRAFQPPNNVNLIPYGANEKAGHYVQANDAKIYYEVYGKGRPIVLLHGGLFGSTVEFAAFIDSLQQGFQVIAISTRGHGKSNLGTEPLTLEQRANDAMAVINAVTTDSVMVLGFSDGGYTAYKLGAMFPNRIKKMVVMGAGELYPGLREFNFTAKQAVEMDKAYWEQQLELMPEPQRLEEMVAQIGNCYNHLTVGKDLLGNIKCPVLVLAGDRDQGNSVEHVVNAARMIPRHQICIIPNTTHTVFLENWQAVWASIAPFLRG